MFSKWLNLDVLQKNSHVLVMITLFVDLFRRESRFRSDLLIQSVKRWHEKSLCINGVDVCGGSSILNLKFDQFFRGFCICAQSVKYLWYFAKSSHRRRDQTN